MKNVAATRYGKKSVVRPPWAGLSVMNGTGDGIRRTPTAGGCLETPGIGTKGDITPKGARSALPGLSREWTLCA